jgi:Ca2+-binding RTX toxin-like protein
MLGGAGNDTYFVDSTSDRVYETTTTSSSNTTDAGGTDRIFSTVSLSLDAYNGVRFVESLTLTGTAAINGTGNILNNTLTGNSAANTLNGGLGKDILTGGTGVDYFDFTSVLNGITNVDTITDFNRADDFIRLDNAVMAGLGTRTGALSETAFFSGAGRTAAADASDRIIYNTTTGDLYYDADGIGSTAAIKIALIGTSSSRPVLDHTDFLII